MGLVLFPEVLREKLGDDGAKELVDLINASSKNARENAEEIGTERLERRIAETEAKLQKEISGTEMRLQKEIAYTRADIIKWMFIFWVGQAAVVYGLIKAMAH
ncbi:hypothetical protein MTAT_26280 [Moorella thermoacetica]|uniref:DUF1640 domain-containing protein n=1 Tax=Neomoorella thermoacetica TaxID=1525 RepID=A0AAC9MTY0_NEOTH|nr:hypothetical protein [Moorella thermoacetica]AOQ23069.1 hypothetical protein Maut_00606 [Moorella thermoacetica]TYL08964.1 hypothetical protein MTAT_26280 [Moorella thermoacetica]